MARSTNSAFLIIFDITVSFMYNSGMKKSIEKLYDCLVIGGGPAGVSSAVYMARGGLSVAMLHSCSSALHQTSSIQNYYGFSEITGAELYERGIIQAKSFGVEVIPEQVTSVSAGDDMFIVYSSSGEYKARRVVIAVGAKRATAKIRGLKELEGKGVSYCAVCDGFFYRKKRVGVIGAGDYARHEYDVLKNLAGEAVLFTDGDSPSFSAQKVFKQKIVSVNKSDGGAVRVELDDGTTVEVDGLFVAIGVLGSAGLTKSLGVFTDENGNIKVDGRGMTNIPGLYAAGDCIPGKKQIAKAVYDGMVAGLAIVTDVTEKRKNDAKA